MNTIAENWYSQAVEKLEKEINGVKGREAGLMKEAVKSALLDFCQQDEEFAQAVVQGGSFAQCMAAVAQGLAGNGISDLAAYKKAVNFYFPGADIRMTMRICLTASVDNAPDAPDEKGIVLQLSDFL